MEVYVPVLELRERYLEYSAGAKLLTSMHEFQYHFVYIFIVLVSYSTLLITLIFCVGLGARESSMQILARTWMTCENTGKPMWKGPLPSCLVIYTVA